MTATFKSLLTLALLLATNAGLAAVPPPTEHGQTTLPVIAVFAADAQASPDRMAWQRVGSPLREA